VSGVVALVVVIALAVLFGWLATRAWRLSNAAARIVGAIVAGLLTLLFAAVAVVGAIGFVRLNAPQGAPAATLSAQVSPERMALAERRLNGCTGCHSSSGSLPLDGGTSNFLNSDSGPALGVLVAPNLTPGGPLKDWSDGEVARAVREGVDRNGRPLLIMPSDAFHHLSDDDVQAVVAYLRSQPASDHQTPTRDVNLLGLMLVGAGLFPTAAQPPISQPQAAPPPSTPDYGKYLIDITGCAACHGANLTGGKPGGFGPPAGPSLRALVPTWQEADFVTFFRTGRDPYGRTLPADSPMPWSDIGKAYTDDELAQMYAYLRQPQ